MLSLYPRDRAARPPSGCLDIPQGAAGAQELLVSPVGEHGPLGHGKSGAGKQVQYPHAPALPPIAGFPEAPRKLALRHAEIPFLRPRHSYHPPPRASRPSRRSSMHPEEVLLANPSFTRASVTNLLRAEGLIMGRVAQSSSTD